MQSLWAVDIEFKKAIFLGARNSYLSMALFITMNGIFVPLCHNTLTRGFTLIVHYTKATPTILICIITIVI